ncbi:MAG: hypothetical protein E6G47_10100 [Actinobacteria bacterium]|nr:MAG: hypothetical protein E6G47_10100 [Actinomycetota bacterium]
MATRLFGAWSTDSIPGGGGYGVSMVLDKNGNPDVAYYDVYGGIHRALSTGTGSWNVQTLGSTTAGAGGQGDARWGTGISVDEAGDEFVTWAETKDNDVMLATAKAGGTFSSVPMPSSTGGWTPALAVSADGTKLAVSWFDSVNLDLDVALPAGPLQLAEVTPTLRQPSVPPPAASCSPNGTSLQIAAPSGASGSGFDTKCLAAPAGTAFSVTFQNQDTTLHNFEIFTDPTGATRLGGASGLTDLVAPSASATYQVDSLKAGSYFFRCDVHPSTMTGTFIVAGK